MKLFSIFGPSKPAPDALPHFIRELQDIRGVRVIRLQGEVGQGIGAQADEADKVAAQTRDAFTRPLLFDFANTTGSDFATVAYLVRALRRRMAAKAQVGIINAPRDLIAELEIAKVGELFRVFASENEALTHLAEASPR